MFEKSLSAKFKSIFQVKKVTFDMPSESHEQECLFIQVEKDTNSIKDGRAHAMITGKAIMLGVSEKLPFGFFSKAIARADVSLTKDLFFYDIETNTQRYRDIVQREFSFVYFFDSQYDPITGTITELDLTLEEH